MLLVWAFLVYGAIATLAQAAVIFMVLMERKALAWLTQRKGPNRVGPAGLLQTLADGVKLLFKEDIMTPGQNKVLFTLAPALFLFPVFPLFALIPFTDYLWGVSLPTGALLLFAISSITTVAVVLAGWASDNKYSLLGGVRSAAQAISYEIPLIMAALAVCLFAGTMNLRGIVEAQQGPLGAIGWFGLYLTPVSFLIFLIASLAEVNRIPFDLPEAESELVSGYNTEYSGMKFAMYFLAEYAALFVMSALAVVFFAGGYLSPLAGVQWGDMTFGPTLAQSVGLAQWVAEATRMPSLGGLLIQLEMAFWFILKTYGFIFFAMWIRGTLPRLKPDQLMGFSWKFLIPLALINVFVVALQRFWAPPASSLAAWGAQAAANWPMALAWLLTLIVGIGGFYVASARAFSRRLNARIARS
ncbi:MAG: NADH-quinone oxidoreductase subunit NuoH [Vampirovibrionales bacterium]|nr:NADH-quinone oxidoreductase subunit NuoH [Vampirovibrionales bacterium]